MIGTLNRLFRPAMVRSARRAFSTNGVTALTSNHFFVDSNVIIGHHLEQYEGLKAFVADTDRHFYYTETVLEELQAASEKLRVPEADPDSPNSNFRFVESGISPDWKEKSLAFFFDTWEETFHNMKPGVKRIFGYDLSIHQKQNFRKDLQIIFEASAVCHKPGVLPDDELLTPPLLTNNMVLWKKFIANERAEDVLEAVINLTGHEHLIPVFLLQDVLEANQTLQVNPRP